MPDAPAAPASATPPRRHEIDNLRNAAVLLLILFHTARLFDIDPWHVKDAHTYPAADLLVRFLNQWHMPLLFLLAGMSSWHALRRHGLRTHLAERVARLLVPLVAGIFLAVYPQVYLERISPEIPLRMSPIDTDLGPLAFLPSFFACCYPAANFSYHHLWFVWYLFVYALLLAPLFAFLGRPGAPARLVGAAAAWLGRGWRTFLPALLLVVIELALRPQFPSTHAFIDDWANHAHFMTLVILGWLLAAAGPAPMALPWRPALTLAALSAVLWQVLPGTGHPGLVRAMGALGEWCWLVGLLGLAGRYVSGRVPLLTGFTRYAFPFYIAHQALIVALGWALFGWSEQPLAKFVAIAALAAAGSLAVARLADRTAATRFLLGLKAPRQSAPPAPRPRPAPATP